MKGTRNRIEDLVRQARCEVGSGNRKKALSLMKRALSLDPSGGAITETILLIEKELSPIAERPHPYEYELYYDL